MADNFLIFKRAGRYVFLILCLFVCNYSFSQEDERLTPLEEQTLREKCESQKIGAFLMSDECLKLKSPEVRHADLQFAVNTELRERSKANYFDYSALVPPQTEEELAREKLITFLIWFGGFLGVACICFVAFRFVKNKVYLRIKQRHGKHTLDDVFAAQKKE